MPKIAQSNRDSGHMVFEDPRPSIATIYLQTHAHEMTSLSPLFGKYMSSDIDGSFVTPQGINKTEQGATGTTGQWGYAGALLQLTKDTVHVQHNNYATGNYLSHNIDCTQFYSMDSSEQARTLRLFTGGGDTLIYSHQSGYNKTAVQDIKFWHNPGASELYDLKPNTEYSQNVVYSQSPSTYNNISYGSTMRYIHLDTASNTLYGVGKYVNRYISGSEYPAFGASKNTGFPFNGSSDHTLGPVVNAHHGNWMGMSADGKPLYFLTAYNDKAVQSQQILKYDPTANTNTFIYAWTALDTTQVTAAYITASGHSGVERSSVTSGSTVANHFFTPSKFHDTATATTKAFYLPHFDSSQNYYPHYFTWDTLTDTVTRFSDTYPRNDTDSAVYSSSTDFNNFYGLTWGNYQAAKSSVCFNETFLWTATNTRYMLLGIISGQPAAHDSQDTARTFITFTIDGSDPKKILFHSKFTVPATAINMVFLNDARTLLAIIMANQTNIYSFTPATGFALATELSLKIWALGRDRLDRIWAATAGISSVYADLHLITPSLPVTVNIVPASTTYNYTGTTLNSNFTLATLDTTGARVSTDVTLVIDGSTITFSDDTKSKIVTTSASGDVTVNIKIVDSGFSQIISSVTI